ncbi:MAG TPA: hypothetical protein VH083_19920 [Myxococcales bacterium]|jgi:hypothetical protein|nr:hypothetical protein [Myxococcales bacterium]
MPRFSIVACLAAAACATEPIAVAAAPTPLRPVPFNAAQFAAGQATPVDCERAAREVRDHDDAWTALVACVERSKWPVGEFTRLDLLISGFWDRDLQTRPDAPRLVAKVIALRGGDVEGDIPTAQKSRVPLFTLAAALREPDVYKGRWVLMRGALADVKQANGSAAALLKETQLRATTQEVLHDGTYNRTETSETHALNGQVQAGPFGNLRADGTLETSKRSESQKLRHRYVNERVETGRIALGKLAEADPFMEPGREFLFLGRFDGTRPPSDDQTAPVAVVTIAGYYAPNALMLQ